ncbi:hypothetical protein YC2023_084649 [Brassica napus]
MLTRGSQKTNKLHENFPCQLAFNELHESSTSTVKDLEGSFGFQLWELWRKENHCNRDDRILKWDAALQDVSGRKALRFLEDR